MKHLNFLKLFFPLGKLFHSTGAPTERLQSPFVLIWDCGTNKMASSEDLKLTAAHIKL